MPPDGMATAAVNRRARMRLVPPAPLRVVDVALFYGERSGGIRTYLDAKARWARESGGIDHHVVVPGAQRRSDDGRHTLPSVTFGAANGYRLPLGGGALHATLRELRPDVVLLHDPFWRPLGVTRTAHEAGARVVAVHHGSVALDAAGLPGPDGPWRALLRRWMHHAYRDVDAVMSAVQPHGDTGRGTDIPLRFGLHPAFRPREHVRRGEHVLYAGRLSREKGVFELVRAAALSAEPWALRLVGSGPAEDAIWRLAQRLGIADRLDVRPFIADRDRLARAYAGARVVVMPGAHETFGLVGLEAAASGAPVVACETAPSAALLGGLAMTYAPGDVGGLERAVRAARSIRPDLRQAAALARRMTWDAAFAQEADALRALVTPRRARLPGRPPARRAS